MKIILFILAGGIGFMTEVIIIQLLVSVFSVSFIAVRAISFPVAVCVTWLFNRKITFLSKNRVAAELSQYVLIQILGGSINLSIYYLIVSSQQFQSINPILALAIAAACSMIFTFLTSKNIVFQQKTNTMSRPEDHSDYSGHENLMVMQHAKNYNLYLQNLILPYITKQSKVLDFGAGLGGFAEKTSEKCSNILCIEPDPYQLNILKEKGFVAAPNIDNTEKQSIDFIYSFNVLEHIEDDQSAVNQLIDKLSVSGVLFIYVPALSFLYSQMDKAVGHYRRYDRNSLSKLCQDKQMKILNIQYVDSVGVLATLVYKYIGNGEGKINLTALKFYDNFIFPVSKFFDLIFNKFMGKNIFIVAQKVS